MHEVFDYIGRIADLAMLAKKAADKMKNAEMTMAMADLISAIADLKIKNAEIVTEKADLMSENRRLQSEINDIRNLKLPVKIGIIGHKYETEMRMILLHLAKSDGKKFSSQAMSAVSKKDISVAKHILSELVEWELVMHHWGIGIDHGYSLGHNGRKWLIDNGVIN